MARSFQIVEFKIEEAGFFLVKLDECSYSGNFFEARQYLNAFLSATRSITFVLKASLHDLTGFTAWYAEHESKLRNSSIARYFLESRNLSQKVGFYPLRGCGSYIDEQGTNRTKFHFSSYFEIEKIKIPDIDVYSTCLSYFTLLLEIVYDCYQVFGFDIDPDRYYTIENMKRLNLTIEDIEEKLALPRGWTGVAGGSIEERIEVIRRDQSTSGADAVLISRLGKNRFGEVFD
jgi:hypothetical protein